MTSLDLVGLPAEQRRGVVFRSSAPAWMLGGALAATGVGFIAGDAITDLWGQGWHDVECSHIVLVPIVFVWLVGVRLGRLRSIQWNGRWPGALIVTVGSVLWWQGYRYQILSVWHGGAVMMAAGAALTVLGSEALYKFLPAWIALAFLVPVPGRVRFYVAGSLEEFTAKFTQMVAEVVGMQVGRSGNQLSVNGVNVCIAEACNGMRLAFTLLLTCYVAVFYRPLRNWVRVIVLALTPVVAVVANIIRLVPTIWMFGHYPGHVAETFHDVAGWTMLLIAFAGLAGLIWILQWTGLPVVHSSFTQNEKIDRKSDAG